MRLTDLLENNGYYFRKMKFCKLKTFLLTILFASISTGILAQTNKLSIHKKETPIIHSEYLQPIITQYFIDNKSEIWLLFLIAHSKR